MQHGKTNTYNYHGCRCKLCKAAVNEQTKTRYRRRIQKVWDLKRKPCVDCGIQYEPWQMQFDHLDSDSKVRKISQLVTHSWKKVLEEIEKCELVCANCHADRTYKRKVSKEKSALSGFNTPIEEARDTF